MSKALATLFCYAALCAQTTLKQLGYPEGTKLLIIHADDLGVAHSVDRASFRALDSRAVTSASIMVPCPWLTELAAYAKEHPDADLGLHLTFTSEWKNYRWGPVSRANLGGLIAPDGYFWPDAQQVIDHARIGEIETELRAQIDRAIKAGIHPTHLDSHMGTLFSGFLPAYEKVAREYGLPFFAARLPGIARNAIRDLRPGLTEMIVHLGYDDAELQAITEDHPAYGSAWRQRDFDLVTSAEFRLLLNDNHVKPIGWKEIKEHWGK